MAPEKLPLLMPDRLVNADSWERVQKFWDMMEIKVSSLIGIMHKFTISKGPSGTRREGDMMQDVK